MNLIVGEISARYAVPPDGCSGFVLSGPLWPIRLGVDSYVRSLPTLSANDYFSSSPTAGTKMFPPKSHPDWTRIGELLLIFFSLIGLAYFLFGRR